MPVEIRELIIKTVVTAGGQPTNERTKKDTETLKKQLLDSCRRMITEKNKSNSYKR